MSIISARSGYTTILKLLLEHGAEVKGSYAFQEAVMNGKIEDAELLLIMEQVWTRSFRRTSRLNGLIS